MEVAKTATTEKPRRWWNHYSFPIIPQFEYRKGDEHNTTHLTLTWLFLKLWTLDSFAFEVGVVCDTHWGIGIIGILPYLRWVVTIPCSMKLEMWISNNLHRKPKQKPEYQVRSEKAGLWE